VKVLRDAGEAGLRRHSQPDARSRVHASVVADVELPPDSWRMRVERAGVKMRDPASTGKHAATPRVAPRPSRARRTEGSASNIHSRPRKRRCPPRAGAVVGHRAPKAQTATGTTGLGTTDVGTTQFGRAATEPGHLSGYPGTDLRHGDRPPTTLNPVVATPTPFCSGHVAAPIQVIDVRVFLIGCRTGSLPVSPVSQRPGGRADVRAVLTVGAVPRSASAKVAAPPRPAGAPGQGMPAAPR
jgi:hypothetical protein